MNTNNAQVMKTYNPDKIKACSYCRSSEPNYHATKENGEPYFVCDKGHKCKPGHQNGCEDYMPAW